jgi:hypothetical protein
MSPSLQIRRFRPCLQEPTAGFSPVSSRYAELTTCSRTILKKLIIRSVNYKITRRLWNRKAHCLVYKSPLIILYWARWIQSTPFNPFTWISILVMSFYLWLGLPSGLFKLSSQHSLRIFHLRGASSGSYLINSPRQPTSGGPTDWYLGGELTTTHSRWGIKIPLSFKALMDLAIFHPTNHVLKPKLVAERSV